MADLTACTWVILQPAHGTIASVAVMNMHEYQVVSDSQIQRSLVRKFAPSVSVGHDLCNAESCFSTLVFDWD